MIKNQTLTFVGNGEFLSAFSAACSQNFTTVSGAHSLTEPVLVSSFSTGRLKRSLHFLLIFWNCKNSQIILFGKKKSLLFYIGICIVLLMSVFCFLLFATIYQQMLVISNKMDL